MSKFKLIILKSVLALGLAILSGCAVGGDQALKIDATGALIAKKQAMDAAGGAVDSASNSVNSASNNVNSVINGGGQ
jgi:hypothetical protein